MHEQTPAYFIRLALLCNLLLAPTCQAFSLEDMRLEEACEILQLDPAKIRSQQIEKKDKIKATNRAYRKCVQENHPDTKRGKAEEAHQMMVAINRAKEVITKYIEEGQASDDFLSPVTPSCTLHDEEYASDVEKKIGGPVSRTFKVHETS